MNPKHPPGILSITDNAGATIDRYTVVFEPQNICGELWYPMLTMSARPRHPQGVGISSTVRQPPRMTRHDHPISFLALPVGCQTLVDDYLRD